MTLLRKKDEKLLTLYQHQEEQISLYDMSADIDSMLISLSDSLPTFTTEGLCLNALIEDTQLQRLAIACFIERKGKAASFAK
jgi:hypothetical protein